MRTSYTLSTDVCACEVCGGMTHHGDADRVSRISCLSILALSRFFAALTVCAFVASLGFAGLIFRSGIFHPFALCLFGLTRVVEGDVPVVLVVVEHPEVAVAVRDPPVEAYLRRSKEYTVDTFMVTCIVR